MLILIFLFFMSSSIAGEANQLKTHFEHKEKMIYKPIAKELLLSMAQDARFTGKILKIKEDTVEVHGNQVFLSTTSNDLCRQTLMVSSEKYIVHTLCFRNNTVLLEYITDFKRYTFSKNVFPKKPLSSTPWLFYKAGYFPLQDQTKLPL